MAFARLRPVLPSTARHFSSSSSRFLAPSFSSICSPFASYKTPLYSPAVLSVQPAATPSPQGPLHTSSENTAAVRLATCPVPPSPDEAAGSAKQTPADPAGDPSQRKEACRLKQRVIGYCQLSGQALYDAGDGKESIFPFEGVDATSSKKKNPGPPKGSPSPAAEENRLDSSVIHRTHSPTRCMNTARIVEAIEMLFYITAIGRLNLLILLHRTPQQGLSKSKHEGQKKSSSSSSRMRYLNCFACLNAGERSLQFAAAQQRNDYLTALPEEGGGDSESGHRKEKKK
ncbi:hypothetical protein Efla_002154 [Eimeria flavescens]